MVIIGVMGGGRALPKTMEDAHELGKLIALEGWVLLNGGRKAGVMDASAKGAKSEGGLTVGILPDTHKKRLSPYIDIPILTGMGAARNWINVLSSQVVVACPGSSGTLSEVALAINSQRPVVFLGWDPGPAITKLAPKGSLAFVETPEQAIEKIKLFLDGA